MYKLTQVPLSGVKGFQDDYTLSDLRQKTEEKLCTQCSENNKAVSYCKACSEYFCDSCLQAHDRLNLFQDHETVSIDKSTNSELMTTTAGLGCTVHSDEQLMLYCQTCHTLVCIYCFTASHNDHKVNSTDQKAIRETEAAISKTLQHMITNHLEYEENLEYIKTIEKEKMEESTKLKDKVNKKADSMIARIEARRVELLQKVDSMYDLEKLRAEREHHERVIAKMEGARQFTKRALNCKNDTTLLALSGQVMTCLKELSRQKLDNVPIEKIEKSQLAWTESTSVSDQTKYIQDMELVGYIQSSHRLPSIKLTLPTIPSEVMCKQKIEFQVTASIIPRRALKCLQIEGTIRFKTHDQSSTPIDPLALYPTPSTADTESDNKVTVEHENSRNVWTVKFTPKQSGAYSIGLIAWADYGGDTIGSQDTPNTYTPNVQALPTQKA